MTAKFLYNGYPIDSTMIKLVNPMSQCSGGKLKMFTSKWTIFTILRIKFDDLLFEKKIVFGHKKSAP